MSLFENGISEDIIPPKATLAIIVFPWLRTCFSNVSKNYLKYLKWNIFDYLFQNGRTSKTFTSTLGFSHKPHPMVCMEFLYLK